MPSYRKVRVPKEYTRGAGYYPKERAARVDRTKMTDEGWQAHKKQKERERMARYNARNPGLTNGRLRKRRATFPWYAQLLAAGHRAKKSNIEFDLTKEWAVERYTGKCELTGIVFVNSAELPAGTSGLRPYSLSIDRIDPRKGYIQDNCRFVLGCVNSFKLQMTDGQMLEVAQALVNKATLTNS